MRTTPSHCERWIAAIAAILVAGLLASPCVALDRFIKFDGVDGEAYAPGHAGWIEIDSVGWDLQRNATYGVPGTQRSSLGDISITKYIDKASPKLYVACCSGQHISSATLELQRTYALSATPLTYMKITLKDVVITSVRPAGSEEASLTESYRHMEEVSFTYGKIRWDYVYRDPASGTPIQVVIGAWNAAADTPESPIDSERALLMH